MERKLPDEIRVLAIDPGRKGLGFAVLEGPATLVDRGVKHDTGKLKDEQGLRALAELIDRYRPQALAVEDHTASRRGVRWRELLTRIGQLARQKRIPVANFSTACVQQAFRPRKDVIAAAIAGRFPELGAKLPDSRKIGDSEHSAMPVLDAVAFAQTFFYFRNRKRLAEQRKSLKAAFG